MAFILLLAQIMAIMIVIGGGIALFRVLVRILHAEEDVVIFGQALLDVCEAVYDEIEALCDWFC